MKTLELSIILPSYNEENNILNTLSTIENALQKVKIKNYEFIFVDDASTDSTKKKILNYINQKKNKIKTKKIFFKKNYGLGAAFRSGALKSSARNVMFIPSDNAHPEKGLISIFRKFRRINKNVLLISYVKNKNARRIFRRVLSKVYTSMLNIIFSSDVKYHNGLNVYPAKDLIKNINQTNGFAFQTEIIIKLLRKNKKIEYVETIISERKSGETNAFKIRNILQITQTIFNLLLRK